MPTKFIPFGPWLPDHSEFITQGTEQAKNVIRTENGYRPFPGLANFGATAMPDGQPTGLWFGKDINGNARQFAMLLDTVSTNSGLYELSTGGLAWATYGAIVPTTTERVRDIQFSDLSMITNSEIGLRKNQLGTDTEYAQVQYNDDQGVPVASAFVIPRFVAVVRDFVVTGYLNDPAFNVQGVPRGGLTPNRVRWSSIFQPLDWRLEGDAATLSDFQDIPDAGEVKGVTGGEYGVILMEDGIFRMDFVGPPAIFAFNRVENARGCIESNSIVQANNVTFYLSEDGWKAFDGQRVHSIGAEKFDRWFKSNSLSQSTESMTAFVDPTNQLIVWGFNGGISAGDVNDTALIYNYQLNEPTYAEFDHALLGAFISPGYDVEDLTGLNASIDLLPAPLDDVFYKAGSKSFGALKSVGGLNTAPTLFTFTGTPDEAIIDTSEMRLGQNMRAKLTMIQTAIEGDAQNVEVQIGLRNRLGKPVQFGPRRKITGDGLYPVLGDSRYQRVRANISGSWRDADGIFVSFNPTSLR